MYWNRSYAEVQTAILERWPFQSMNAVTALVEYATIQTQSDPMSFATTLSLSIKQSMSMLSEYLPVQLATRNFAYFNSVNNYGCSHYV